MEDLTEKMVSSKKVFDGKIIKVFYDDIILPNNKKATREKVWHPGAVAIVPINKDKEIILIKQYRYPVEEVLIEIPAGKLDSGEDPAQCAKRELKEEIGATGGELIHLLSFHTTPGFSNEILHLYLALNFENTGSSPDEDEFLQIINMPLKESLDFVLSGKIKDAKTIIGILMAFQYFKK